MYATTVDKFSLILYKYSKSIIAMAVFCLVLTLGISDAFASSDYSKYVGKLSVAAYTDNYKTYKGKEPTAGKTVAAKLSMFDIGESIKIGEKTYTVESVLSESSANHIMIYYDNKKDAYAYGMKEEKVYRKADAGKTASSESSSKKSSSSKSSSKSSKKAEANKVSTKSLGTFKTTGYCNCSQCAGAYAGKPTSSGVMPTASHTIAADPSVLPMGTKVMINGKQYKVEDTGSSIKGNKIDIYYDNHDSAMGHGVKNYEVFIVN